MGFAKRRRTEVKPQRRTYLARERWELGLKTGGLHIVQALDIKEPSGKVRASNETNGRENRSKPCAAILCRWSLRA